jgi:hypothetical protein
MNPGPGTSWPDLHYVEAEQVQLDVAAIIARGTRLRRKRLISKVAVVAAVAGVVPTAVVMVVRTPAPSAPIAGLAHRVSPADTNGTRRGPAFGRDKAGLEHPAAPASSAANQVANPLAGIFESDLSDAPAQVVVRHTTTLSRRYGPLLAIAGSRGGSGVWFAATAAQLTLFRLSVTGTTKSWRLPTPASSGGTNVGLTVTADGVAWLGVASTVLRLDTRTAQISSWQMPAAKTRIWAGGGAPSDHQPAGPAYSAADSLAVSPDGRVAIAGPRSSSVQVLDPRNGRFRQIRLPDAADQPVAVGYARNGTLGIGFEHLGQRPVAGLLLVEPSGAELSTPVEQPTSVAAYGASGLLVGVTKLEVVSTLGLARPLLLPANTDFTDVRSPPAQLPGNRLGIAMDTAILTFPATATSVSVATAQSQLWVAPTPRCRSHRDCPGGYRMTATDGAGDMWVVPAAHQRTLELVSLG